MITEISIALSLLAVVFSLFPRSQKPTRAAALSEIARLAVDSARSLKGASGFDKLNYAISCAQKLDMSDNKKRDFSDAQLRLAIEAVLHESKDAK